MRSPAKRCLVAALFSQQRCPGAGEVVRAQAAPEELWGGRRWVLLSAWLGVRIRKYQGADEENHTSMCYLQWCFDEGGGFKIIVLKNNREGDFLTEN